jgi:ubiquinone/menaquinone biosynthesis C-methylase UbiE
MNSKSPQTIKDTVAGQFSPVADNYRTSTVHATGEDLTAMLAAAALRGDERVLDAGSGAGHTALLFAPHVAHVVSVDLAPAMLAQGERQAQERRLTNMEFRQGDVEALPFADGTFDLVVSRYSAHHWPHPQRALGEFHRVLRPGGGLLLSDIVSYEDFTTDTHLQTLELLRDRSHVRDHTVSAWRAMLQGAGFAAEVAFTWSLRLEFAAWVQRIATPPDDVAAIRRLFDHAPAEVRAALQIEPDYSFTIPGALVKARRA